MNSILNRVKNIILTSKRHRLCSDELRIENLIVFLLPNTVGCCGSGSSPPTLKAVDSW